MKPAITNDKREFLLGKKNRGGIHAFRDALIKYSIIFPGDSDDFARFISDEIDQFSVSGGALRGKQSAIYEGYYKQFVKLICT